MNTPDLAETLAGMTTTPQNRFAKFYFNSISMDISLTRKACNACQRRAFGRQWRIDSTVSYALASLARLVTTFWTLLGHLIMLKSLKRMTIGQE